MSSGTGFHLNWNKIPDDMEQAYILAGTIHFTYKHTTKACLWLSKW